MGSSSKKGKEKECRKRRHRSRSSSVESREVESNKEKKHRHKKHHKERNSRKEKRRDYDSDGSYGQTCSPEVTIIQDSPERESNTEQKLSSESLSVDETNKLRAKLGLKPLTVDVKPSTSDPNKKKDDLGEFYHKPAQNMAAKASQEKLKKRISDQKEKRQLEGKLAKVRLLADSDSDDDTSAWVHKSKQLELAKKEAEKRSKLLEELDEQFGIGAVIESETRQQKQKSYTENNLKGLRVDHDTDNFQEGKTLILTLKDQEILAEDGDDVLVNVNLLDNERYKKSNENKKKKPGYSAYDDEVDEFGQIVKKNILDKYDEEDQDKSKGFAIGQDNIVEKNQRVMQSIKDKLANRRLESLILPERTLASDYYNEEEMAVRFKKTKRKVKKDKIRTKDKYLVIDDTPAMPEDSTGRNLTEFKREPEEKQVERALIKARKKIVVDDDAQLDMSWLPIKNEPTATESDSPVADSGNIVLNATAEFCRTLGDIPTYGKSGNRDEALEMLEEMETQEPEDENVASPEGGTWNSVEPGTLPIKTNISLEAPILDEEPDVGSGVGAALKLAMSKGYLDKEENNRPSNTRLAHLQAKHYSIEDKSYGDDDKGGGRRERYSGPIQEFREKDGFKPNVKLEYIGDDGHILNSKEAFRYLSHKFHGKGPGKNKIEKRIKKTQQEGLMKKMSSTDTPLGTLNMLQAKQKEMQSPYIVLSGSKHTHSTTISKARR